MENDQTQVLYFQMNEDRLIEYNEENKPYVNTTIIWNYAKFPKVKTMYFGKYRNEMISNTIKTNMAKKIKTSETARANYDVSFEYNPENNKAWYSEEYKNCGNGHYYIALNNKQALFVEDD